MIVDQATVDFITGKGCRKLYLPFKRGGQGELLPCPVEQHEVFKLWCGVPGRKGVAVTAVAVKRANAAEAKGAVQPHGAPGPEGWLIVFVLGDLAAFYELHAERFLSKSGITTNPRRAIRGEPSVTTEDDLKNARVAGEKRGLEEEQRWRAARAQMQAAISALEAAGAPPADVGFLLRRLAKVDRCRAEKRVEAA